MQPSRRPRMRKRKRWQSQFWHHGLSWSVEVAKNMVPAGRPQGFSQPVDVFVGEQRIRETGPLQSTMLAEGRHLTWCIPLSFRPSVSACLFLALSVCLSRSLSLFDCLFQRVLACGPVLASPCMSICLRPCPLGSVCRSACSGPRSCCNSPRANFWRLVSCTLRWLFAFFVALSAPGIGFAATRSARSTSLPM